MSKREYEMGSANRRRGPGGRGPGGRGPAEKPKDLIGTYKKLLGYGKAYVPGIVIAMILAMAGSILTIIGPDRLMDMTAEIQNGLMGTIDMHAVAVIGVWLIVIYAFSAVFSYVQGWIMATLTQKLSKRLRKDISDKINLVPLKYFDNTSTGDVLSRVTNDVDTVGMTLNQSAGNLVSAVTLLLGSLIMMILTDGIMTLAAVLASILGFVLMGLIMSKSQKYFLAQQKHLGEINGHVEEVYAGHNVLRVYNAEQKSKEEFEEINEKLFKSNFKAQFLSGLMPPLMGFIGNLGYVVVCVVGAVLTMNGKIDFPVIVAFIMYVRYFTQPLNQIAQAAMQLQSTAAASERVFEFLDAEEMEDESQKQSIVQDARGEVEFCHVKFGYDEDRTIIHDFSARIAPGQKVAIVGPTGAGKTTMVNLLMRFYETNAGEIKIDGVPIQQMTRQNVHERFGMVLQDTWLFEGTIRENLVYGKNDVTDEALNQACKAAGIYHFIRTLPKGYDTVLNDKLNLSSGQKQLMTIARAMIENAPMLILDEATSSVDTRTEVLIQEAMDRLTHGRTSFVIAHRLSTIKNADLILVMKDGDVIESGTHEELLSQKGFYADLYNSQFERVS